jgi:RimJ/RimL family protein N-acetyltransferase
MSAAQPESLIEASRETLGPLMQFVPDTPWTTTTLQAIQNRKATVHVDDRRQPRAMVVAVRGGDHPGDHDQAYVFGEPSSGGLRAFVAGVTRRTEFILDDELAPLVREIHPGAEVREAMCCWFDRLEPTPSAQSTAPVRRLRLADADAAQHLIPHWAFRTFESPKDMILGGGCFAVELNGKLASVAYVADQSVKHARIAVVTGEAHRRRGYGFAAARRLMDHLGNEGRLVCALVPRRKAAAVHFALKLGFPQKGLLRTYKVRPGEEASPVESTSSIEQTQF